MDTGQVRSTQVPMNVLRDIQKTVGNAGKSPKLMAAAGASFGEFLAICPDSVKAYFNAHPELKANVDRLTAEAAAIDAPKPGKGIVLKSGGLQCWACKTGAWAGIVIALAGVIVVTQGAAVAPLIAMDAGLIAVFAAIFGISDAAMATIAGAAGITLAGLVTAGCESAGCC